MCDIVLTIPDESLASLRVSPEQAAAELRMLAAVKLFEMNRLSSGAAARLAGVPRTMFLQRLGDYGVDTFRFTPEELDRETPIV